MLSLATVCSVSLHRHLPARRTPSSVRISARAELSSAPADEPAFLPAPSPPKPTIGEPRPAPATPPRKAVNEERQQFNPSQIAEEVALDRIEEGFVAGVLEGPNGPPNTADPAVQIAGNFTPVAERPPPPVGEPPVSGRIQPFIDGATFISSKVVEYTSVFQPGKLTVEVLPLDNNAIPTAPIPIVIAAPKDAGSYPVVIFLHGFLLKNHFYEQLLKHIASFGFIIIAPQFQTSFESNSGTGDVEKAAEVSDWLVEGLPSVLHTGVKPDLSKLALAGHSRGDHTAFSLALRHTKTNQTFSALIGIEPVAGTGKSSQLQPALLTSEPSSFDIAMPILVIGAKLSEEKKNVLFPSCAPRYVNHQEFYLESKAPCYYFVVKEYGHLDMLDDDAPRLVTCLCKGSNCSKDAMRRTVAGIVVAFLRAVVGDEDSDLKVILKDPQVAPTMLDPVEKRLG